MLNLTCLRKSLLSLLPKVLDRPMTGETHRTRRKTQVRAAMKVEISSVGIVGDIFGSVFLNCGFPDLEDH